MVRICPKCGKESPDISNFCIKCGTEFESNLGFDKYINQETIDILESTNLSKEEYKNIINDIIDNAKVKYNKLISESPFTKEDIFPLDDIKFIAQSFASLSFKKEVSDYGHYGFNLIEIDERLNPSLQIFAIIKQLAHHLLAEILENVFVYVLGVEKDDELESVVAATFKFEAPRLMDEYCACMIQEYFIPYGFQNYNSFYEFYDNVVDKNSEDVVFYLNLANSLAQDIIFILNEFIDDKLREKIRIQFKVDAISNDYGSVGLNNNIITLKECEKINSITSITLKVPIEVFLNDNESYDDILDDYKDKFNSVNNSN